MNKPAPISKDDRYAEIQHILLEYISGKRALPCLEECDDYIAAFSFFLYNLDSDYVYNIPFLKEEHYSFYSFLGNAKMQYTAMENILSEVFSSELSTVVCCPKAGTEKQIVLSLNGFIQVSFNGRPEISFCNPISLSGGNRDQNHYLFTLYNGNIPLCFESSAIDNLIKYVKDSVTIHLMDNTGTDEERD